MHRGSFLGTLLVIALALSPAACDDKATDGTVDATGTVDTWAEPDTGGGIDALPDVPPPEDVPPPQDVPPEGLWYELPGEVGGQDIPDVPPLEDAAGDCTGAPPACLNGCLGSPIGVAECGDEGWYCSSGELETTCCEQAGECISCDCDCPDGSTVTIEVCGDPDSCYPAECGPACGGACSSTADAMGDDGGEAPDVGPDATCGDDTVPTVDGCLTCSEALTAVNAAKDAAKDAHDACSVDEDCVLAGFDTDCAGACPVAIAATEQADFLADLQHISADYCTGYVPVCGYMTPGCMGGEAVCDAGSCAFEWAVP